MKKKILSLLYILILNSNAYSASEPQLPPPLPLSEEIVNPSNKEDSFWNKALNFFGFGNKKQENPKALPIKTLPDQNTNDLGDNKNNTTNINSELSAKNLSAITKDVSTLSFDQALTNNKSGDADKNLLQKIPDISDLKLPDGIKPDEELPSKPKAVVSDNTSPNSQLLTEKDAKNNISDLKLPDGIKPDEELPSKPKAVVSDNTSPNSQLLTEKDAKNNISDLKLPDGIKPDEELPSKPKAVVSDVVSLNTSDASNKDPQNTSEQNIALSLPTTDNKSATNNKALAVDDNAIPNTSAENANSKNNTPLSTTGNLSEPKTDKVPPENVKLIQNPAGQSSQNTEASNVKTYRQHFQDRLNKTQQLPEISKDDLNPVAAPEEANPAQMKFVNDEAQVLILPNDEVVLGEVTKESQLELMDLNSYLKIFWDNYYSIKNEPARKAINNFIKNYDANFNKQDTTIKNENIDALSEAFKAIDRNNIYDFINLLDSYPIIQLVDCDGNTLLHKAVYKNNYPAAKFLIMKGIDLSTKNNQGVTALEIAVSQNSHEIETLLRSAGAK